MFLATTATSHSFFELSKWSSDEWQAAGVIFAVFIGICTIIGLLVKAIYKFGSFMERFNQVEKIATDIAQELKALRTDLSGRIDRLADIQIQDNFSVANSPRVLNELGLKVLKESGIGDVVDSRFEQIVKNVQKAKPENAYQAEQSVLQVVEDLFKDPTLKDAVENGAFQSGQPISGILYIGGLYIRDRVLKEIGFEVKDIDNHDHPQDSSKVKK